jgi:hypothetical protein
LHREDAFDSNNFDAGRYRCPCACHKTIRRARPGVCSCHSWCKYINR